MAAIILLTFLGTTAVAGAVPMILNPGGSALMPLALLRYSPFHSFLVPGIVLFVANGLLSLVVLTMVLRRSTRHGMWAVLQGGVLLGWLITECWMLRAVVWLHWLYAGVALLLILSGLVLQRRVDYG